MGDNFAVQWLTRALGERQLHRSVKTLYGDRSWAEDLDIVNELGGHTGCVNALSWATSGSQLASGSDDTYLNIWDFNPSSLAKPFTLNTSVNTGHHANIFSVKFMPHSNDRTVVTCAGDSEVRVFDLEYRGGTNTASDYSSSTRSRRFNDFFGNARWLSESNINARVYRSHGDRAKRIVTESSPHLFLTCSEDGEVRQWDLRMPSSAYPAPTRDRGFPRFRRTADQDESDSGNVPPPLISYKRYALDLNSISCAPSQPQYIALGGAHLHCFLHDRRMLGRDKSRESGKPSAPTPAVGTNEDEAMSEATQCVKRFAPNNKRKMGTHDTGHITACKIRDANPNEMVASWSVDHIYSFDIVKSPDARDKEFEEHQHFLTTRLKNYRDRKRKRKQKAAFYGSLAENGNPPRRLRRVSDSHQEDGHTLLQVRYENGETEDVSVPIGDDTDSNTEPHETLLNQAQMLSEGIARSIVQLRKTIFDFSASLTGDVAAEMENSTELTPHTTDFTQALRQCSSLLPEMEEVIRTWSYPINPSEEDVILQNTLRRSRQATWRLVQATGCLSRVLGGRLQTLSLATDPRLDRFDQIRPAIHEGRNISPGYRFCYDFLKAILCWLGGGSQAVLQAFKRPPFAPADSPRYFLSETDDLQSFVPKLHDYLSKFADHQTPVVDLDANRFERDESRLLFPSQKHAVQAFTRALSGIQLELQQGPSGVRADPDIQGDTKRVMDKGAAARFWGVKVGRSLLMHAGEGVTFDFVNRAFGGLRLHVEESEERSQEDVDSEAIERVVESIDVVIDENNGSFNDPEVGSSASPSAAREGRNESTHTGSIPPPVATQDARNSPTPSEVADGDEDNDNDDDESDDREDGADEEETTTSALFRRRVAFGRFREKAVVNLEVPYSSHTRAYKGHCNIRTVKDVNYYGLDDEYVVSGSDDGHFFIWDRKTTKIVNILKGDGEVVNVVQGHPYEPMIACSGIDSTVKIFGPGGESRERDAAARGVNIANPGGSVHSSLGGRRRRRVIRQQSDDDDDDDDHDDRRRDEVGVNAEGLKSRKAMHREYEITSQNDAERRRGYGDAFVTEGMLARFAAALQQGQIQGIVGNGPGGGGGTVVVDDNCLKKKRASIPRHKSVSGRKSRLPEEAELRGCAPGE